MAKKELRLACGGTNFSVAEEPIPLVHAMQAFIESKNLFSKAGRGKRWNKVSGQHFCITLDGSFCLCSPVHRSSLVFFSKINILHYILVILFRGPNLSDEYPLPAQKGLIALPSM